MERITSKITTVVAVTLLCAVAAKIAVAQKQDVNDLNALAARGEVLAGEDPLALELRGQQREESARRGFDIGMGLAEGQTLPGPGKDSVCASLPLEFAQLGCRLAVLFSVDRNRNAVLAARGAAIAEEDPLVAEARTIIRSRRLPDIFYRLGFDIGMAAAEGQ